MDLSDSGFTSQRAEDKDTQPIISRFFALAAMSGIFSTAPWYPSSVTGLL